MLATKTAQCALPSSTRIELWGMERRRRRTNTKGLNYEWEKNEGKRRCSSRSYYHGDRGWGFKTRVSDSELVGVMKMSLVKKHLKYETKHLEKPESAESS